MKPSGWIETPQLKPAEFAEVRELAYRRFGLDLREGKQQLVWARLSRQLRQGGFRSFREYFDHVKADASGESLIALIDALTTNYTSFLRERDHFEFLAWAVANHPRSQRLRLWCAAAATGEEPYSMLFTCLDHLQDERTPVEILASDISTRALETARKATYAAARLADVPKTWLDRYFILAQDQSLRQYRVRPEYLARIQFQRINLIEPFHGLGQFQMIFCRNVMIYFDQRTRADVVRRLVERLQPGGFLIVGHAESLIGIEHGLEYVQPAVYRRPASAAHRLGEGR